MAAPAEEGRLFTSLRRLLATVFELAQVRIDLFSTEFELEKRRVFDGLLWAAVAVVFLGVGLCMLCAFVLLFFWDSYRLWAAGAMAFLLIAGGAFLMAKARQRLKSVAGMFHLSLLELERDISDLRSSNAHEQR